jgi:GDPmannose 4,6-dehydratase
MWRMMQADKPDTYVLATNRTETVRDFATMAFAAAGLGVEWVGQGEKERGLCPKTGRELVRINPDFYRAAEVDLLKGDASKARKLLGWEPETTLEQLCAIMVEADLERVSRELAVRHPAPKPRRNRSKANGHLPVHASGSAPESIHISPALAPTR